MQNLLKIVVVSACIVTLKIYIDGPIYKGPKSDNFNGEIFVNRLSVDKGLLDILRLAVTFPFQRAKWPEEITNDPADSVATNNHLGIASTIINHSTVLLQVDGINILTDPVFSKRVSPFSFAGPKRVIKPAVSIANLPSIDVILISHNHYDHLDIDSLSKIINRKTQITPPVIFAGLGNGVLFEKYDIGNYQDLDWGDSVSYQHIEFEFVETRHRSGRGITDQMKTLWGGFVMRTEDGSNIYFGGDTGYGPHFKQANEKFGSFELALIPIGAYEPRWFMAPMHLNPEEAVLAHKDLNSYQSIAIHHSTFQLTLEGIDQPKSELQAALKKHQVSTEKFVTPKFGKKIIINSENL